MSSMEKVEISSSKSALRGQRSTKAEQLKCTLGCFLYNNAWNSNVGNSICLQCFRERWKHDEAKSNLDVTPITLYAPFVFLIFVFLANYCLDKTSGKHKHK